MDNNYQSCSYQSTQSSNNANNKRYHNNNHYQQSNSTNISHLPTPPLLPLMALKPTPRSSALFTGMPHEHESWIRSVKKRKLNETTEQRVQYLETMLRMPQPQKPTLDPSTFDRIRFANDQRSITLATLDSDHTIRNLSSFPFIPDAKGLEQLLFNHDIQSKSQICPSQINDNKSTTQTNSEAENFSGFLIDNCDEELSPLSSPPALHISVEKSIEQNQADFNQQDIILVNELNIADAERKKELKRQKRLRRKLHKKKKLSEINKFNTVSNVNNNSKKNQESSSDWIIEYNTTETDEISQLADAIKNASVKITDGDKINKINSFLKKIKRQQHDLKKLRQSVISMLDEGQQQQISNDNPDLLMKFLNQPLISGCWLCSGKRYTETATQCNNTDE